MDKHLYIKWNGAVVYKMIRPGVYEVHDNYAWAEYNRKHPNDPLPHRQAILGWILKDIRLAKGLTISELARKSDIDKSVLSRMENNPNYNTSVKTISKLADVLECSPLYLTGDIDDLDDHYESTDLGDIERKIITAYKKADAKTKLIVMMLLDIDSEDDEYEPYTDEDGIIWYEKKK